MKRAKVEDDNGKNLKRRSIYVIDIF
jgi:hypothetical protein